MSEAATNGASPNLYEVIGRIVVILAAMWILWQLLGAALTVYKQISPTCVSFESQGRTADGWMSRTLSGQYRIQQRDGSWAFFGDFDSITFVDADSVCSYPSVWMFQV